MKIVKLLALLTLILLLGACSDENSDPVDNEIGFAATVQPIVNANCLTCHSNPPTNYAPMSLTSYSLVKNAVQNLDLIDRIERTAGTVGAMPASGGPLSASDIQTIKDWQAGGFLN